MNALIEFFTADNLIFLLQGAGKSLLLAACALVFGLILGVLGAAAKISKHKILRIIGNIYVELIRGTPMLLQILFIYCFSINGKSNYRRKVYTRSLCLWC